MTAPAKSVFHRPTCRLDVAVVAVEAIGKIGIEAPTARAFRRASDARVARIAIDELRNLVRECLSEGVGHGNEAPSASDDPRPHAAGRGTFGRDTTGTALGV